MTKNVCWCIFLPWVDILSGEEWVLTQMRISLNEIRSNFIRGPVTIWTTFVFHFLFTLISQPLNLEWCSFFAVKIFFCSSKCHKPHSSRFIRWKMRVERNLYTHVEFSAPSVTGQLSVHPYKKWNWLKLPREIFLLIFFRDVTVGKIKMEFFYSS